MGKHKEQCLKCKHVVLLAIMGSVWLEASSGAAVKITTSIKHHKEGRERESTWAVLALQLLTSHKLVVRSPRWSFTTEPSKQCENNRIVLRKLILSMSFDPCRQ